jgi:hypothetical protein
LDLSYRAQLKLGIQISWNVVTPAELPAIISATRSNSLDGIKEELKTSVKMPLAYSNQSLLDWKQKRMACFIYWIAPCFWRFSRWQSKRTYVIHQNEFAIFEKYLTC